jgi:hypothetical protein
MIGLSGLLLLVLYNPPPPPNPDSRSFTARLRDFHLMGSFLLAASLVPLMMGLIWGKRSSMSKLPR